MSAIKSPPTSPLADRTLPQPPGSSRLHQPTSARFPSSPANSMTSPLKVSKRTPLPAIPRRNSSSYKHLRSNNLVSKSPFRSHIPTSSKPSAPLPILLPTRRVSIEKRPRPDSMHEQAENEKPLLLKRERKQSQAYQGLLQKEPVSKSPFRYTMQPEPPLDTAPTRRLPVPTYTPSRLPTPATSSSRNSNSPSPQRSSLVSKRLHGPRLSGGRRERRKTVTWHERCDVIEIERRSEMNVDVFGSDSEQEISADSMDFEDQEDDEHMFFQAPPQPDHAGDDSYESDQELDLDTSITGMVDSMLNENGIDRDVTPPKDDEMLPADTDLEDGIPLGRSHHRDRLYEFHEQRLAQYPEDLSQTFSTSSRPTTPVTPPLNINRPLTSTPPLGRSTHIERVLAAKREHEEEEEDADRMPTSPSPIKPKRPSQSGEQALFPALDLGPRDSGSRDDFFLPDEDEIPGPDASFLSMSDSGRKPATPTKSVIMDDVPESDVSGSLQSINLGVEPVQDARTPPRPSIQERLAAITPPPTTTPDGSPQKTIMSSMSTPPRRPPLPAIPNHPPALLPNRTPPHMPGSPLSRPGTASPVPRSNTSSPSLRTRISREDIRKRLMRRQSQEEGLNQTSDGAHSNPSTPQKDDLTYENENSGSVCTDDVVVTAAELATATIEKAEHMNACPAEVVPTPPTPHSDLPILGTNFAPQMHSEEEEWEEQNEGQGQDEGVRVEVDMEDVRPELPHEAEGPLSPPTKESFNSLTVDFGGQFGLKGLGISGLGSRSTRGSFDSNTVKVGDVDVDMEMRSALDRLMEDVATNSALTDDEEAHHSDRRPSNELSSAFKASPVSRNGSATSIPPIRSPPPPPVPPKNSIQQREALILAKRRAGKGTEGGRHLKAGNERPARRRSMSTGDAEDMRRTQSAEAVLEVPVAGGQDELRESINRELNKFKDPPKPTKYQVREREGIVYASSDDKVTHLDRVGDLNSSKAWRPVRRPSDMNEYSKQIKEYRSMDKGKAYGKVFVRVVGIKNLDVPLPPQETAMSVTLNNGIHYVTTPECKLERDSSVEQEFELVEHSKLEFTLTVKVRRDPHIIAQMKSQAPGPAPPPAPTPLPITQPSHSSKSSGMRSFFSSSPRKAKEKAAPALPPPPPPQQRQQLQENLSRYLRPDGTLARAFVSFKDISQRCDTRLFETTFPLIGQRLEPGSKTSSMQVGELVLQLFRLPPLPGLPQDGLPQSLDECHRGLRHVNWHKVTYFEGTLTQNGGDCSSWRRRQFRVIGGNLVAFNDVTKRATASIDLKKAIAVEDDQAPSILSPSSARSSRGNRHTDEFDGLYGVERSFRLIFPNDEHIVFFADTDEEKARWLDVLNALIGHIPPHPLWAELLWQRQEEINKRYATSKAGRPSAHGPSKSYPH